MAQGRAKGSPSPGGRWCSLSEDREGPSPGRVRGGQPRGHQVGLVWEVWHSPVEPHRGRDQVAGQRPGCQAEWAAELLHRLQQGTCAWDPSPQGGDTHLPGSRSGQGLQSTHRGAEPKGPPEMALQLITRLHPHCGQSTRRGRRKTHREGQARPAPSSGGRAAGNEVVRHVSPTSAPKKETVSPRSNPREAKARSPQKSRLADPRAPLCPSG